MTKVFVPILCVGSGVGFSIGFGLVSARLILRKKAEELSLIILNADSISA